MPVRAAPALLALSLMAGCDALGLGTDSDTELPPPPVTARFTADAWVQDCRWTGRDWLGVERLTATLEHRSTDALADRGVPAVGACTTRASLFAEESLDGGDDVPGLAGRPRYASLSGDGALTEQVPGLYQQSLFQGEDRCGTLDESLDGGITLTEGGHLAPLTTPSHGQVEAVWLDGARFTDRSEPIELGQELVLDWQATGWQQAFVQVRRTHQGEIRETITCGVTGLDTFTLDNDVWSLASPGILADDIGLIVGFVNQAEVEVPDGTARAATVTRALHTLAPR